MISCSSLTVVTLNLLQNASTISFFLSTERLSLPTNAARIYLFFICRLSHIVLLYTSVHNKCNKPMQIIITPTSNIVNTVLTAIFIIIPISFAFHYGNVTHPLALPNHPLALVSYHSFLYEYPCESFIIQHYYGFDVIGIEVVDNKGLFRLGDVLPVELFQIGYGLPNRI